MNDAPDRPVFEARKLTKVFTKGGKTIEVLDGLELSLKSGEVVGILGASGAGKSTLLHIAGGLDRPSSGTVHYGGKDIFSLSEPDLASFRNRRISTGFSRDALRAGYTVAVKETTMAARQMAATSNSCTFTGSVVT